MLYTKQPTFSELTLEPMYHNELGELVFWSMQLKVNIVSESTMALPSEHKVPAIETRGEADAFTRGWLTV